MSKDNRSYTKLYLAGERDVVGQPFLHQIVSSGRTRCRRTTLLTLNSDNLGTRILGVALLFLTYEHCCLSLQLWVGYQFSFLFSPV
ncbi:uncharacterized protein [Atheta coriaria]|uniref:uncharacterized protein isoform X4 n=1 Tax=Dalotia coriaria TaxID=877792 RepID=UPI0031F37110